MAPLDGELERIEKFVRGEQGRAYDRPEPVYKVPRDLFRPLLEFP